MKKFVEDLGMNINEKDAEIIKLKMCIQDEKFKLGVKNNNTKPDNFNKQDISLSLSNVVGSP